MFNIQLMASDRRHTGVDAFADRTAPVLSLPAGWHRRAASARFPRPMSPGGIPGTTCRFGTGMRRCHCQRNGRFLLGQGAASDCVRVPCTAESHAGRARGHDVRKRGAAPGRIGARGTASHPAGRRHPESRRGPMPQGRGDVRLSSPWRPLSQPRRRLPPAVSCRPGSGARRLPRAC